MDANVPATAAVTAASTARARIRDLITGNPSRVGLARASPMGIGRDGGAVDTCPLLPLGVRTLVPSYLSTGLRRRCVRTTEIAKFSM